MLKRAIAIVLVVALAIGGYILYRRNSNAANRRAVNAYCAALAATSAAANENNAAQFTAWRHILDNDSISAGGEFRSGTLRVEEDILVGSTTDAAAQFQLLRDDCAAAGHPV